MPSLQGMQDIVLPPSISLWPATAAWAILAALLLGLLFWLINILARRRRAEAYRREALRFVTAALAQGDTAALPALVKRTALAAFPRARVAALTGGDWAAFLRTTAPAAHLSEAEVNALTRWPYLTGQDQRQSAAAAAARQWIAQHDRRL
jgi:Domain of unknown function (DUF4381)